MEELLQWLEYIEDIRQENKMFRSVRESANEKMTVM